MRAFISNLKHSLFFLIPYGVFLIVSGIILVLYTKADIHLAVNRHYSHFGDVVMPYVTWGGEGIPITIFILMMFAWNKRFAFFTGISCLLASTITIILKHTLFYGDPRPKLFFSIPSPLHFVPGVENYLTDTFPSGHTTIAFAFYFSLVFAMKNNFLKLGLFLCAILVGYSRIYLSQHFLSDVFGGSLIGTVTSFTVFTIAIQKGWLNLQNLSSQNEA